MAASSAAKAASATVTVNLEPPEVSSATSEFSVAFHDFQPKPAKKARGASDYMIIGFDTEYVVPEQPATRAEIHQGTAKYDVLSYQFCVILSSGEKWTGIAIPAADQRMSMGELVVFALGARESSSATKLPTLIYLVGHYTKADVPAFRDFKDLKSVISAVRGSFVTIDMDSALSLTFPEGDVELRIKFRDTYVLSPAGSQSLAHLGEMLGIPKVSLHSDPHQDRALKSRMDQLRATDWPLFRRYAIQDAVICAEYAAKIIGLCQTYLGKSELPITLTSIGVDMLLKSWEASGQSASTILGKEKVTEKKWNKKRGYMMKVTRDVPLVNCDLFENLATESYHGGRNEQFWFGPAFEDDWTDYDLSSAYATAMALIGMPDWTSIEPTRDIERFQVTTLGYALVEFEFPATVRFPSLPVRTDNGLIFPRKGVSFCASPEIFVARSLGARLEIKQGVIIASDNSNPVFADYIRQCIAERRKHPKKSLNDLFWKELSNSTYGKTAQGLREKRVYDSRAMETVPLPPSKITNPYFAAFITSLVRAVLGEILNALPLKTCVFSCTTDGFLTNATADQIDASLQGKVAKTFSDARTLLTGESGVLEVKHTVRYPLGWRTRGQATLVPGKLPDDKASMNTVLAKGGIHLSSFFDTSEEQNQKIVELFFSRTPDTAITFESLVGLRDIVEHDADLVRTMMTRRVNMEFDWKRKPELLFDSIDYKHVAFCTTPWDSVEQFQQVREYFENYQERNPVCIKTVADFDGFSYFVDIKNRLSPDDEKHARGDWQRLRLMLCAAWHADKCGVRQSNLITTAAEFAAALTECGIPCDRNHVEYGKRRVFVEYSVPPTDRALVAASKLKAKLPAFDPDLLWSRYDGGLSILPDRRPYERDAIADAPEHLRPFFQIALRQTSGEIKAQFETPRTELAKRVPHWMR